MGSQWIPYGFQLHNMFSFVYLIFFFAAFRRCCSLNLEGLALLDFRAGIDIDPYGVFDDWNFEDTDPCVWAKVYCEDGKVQILDLGGLSLEGTLARELGKLQHLKTLILHKNHLTGSIPKEFGELIMLEVLDLSSNNLSGTIPSDIGQMLSLQRLLLCNNKFHGSIPLELGNLTMLSEIQFDQNLTFAVDSGVQCLHRKFGHCIWQKDMEPPKKDSLKIQIKRKFQRYVDELPWFSRKNSFNACGESYCESLTGSAEPNVESNSQPSTDFVRRKLIQDSTNLAAAPAPDTPPPKPTTTVIPTRSSGSFRAIPKSKITPSSPQPPVFQSPNTPTPPSPSSSSSFWENNWMYIVGGICGAVILAMAVILLFTGRRRGVKTIGPWKSGLSGQLQKAFVTGVPKLNRSELETACEDFSNIIDNLGYMTMYKGTLSSGVEIAVASTTIKAYKDWSLRSERAYRKQIDSLSRVNHKNFVNLLGFCEEDEPFSRMMVFEYAPSGSLFEHLHVQEVEHLDWNSRVRVIMGVGYCLQYMHELSPPVAVTNLQSRTILLTDDYAAKVGDTSFWADILPKSKKSGELYRSESSSSVDPETNVYGFGLLLLEIISGKLQNCEKEGPILDWASQYLNNRQTITDLTDPTLKTFKTNELEIVCEVVKECIRQEPSQRPTMREIISKLREVIPISPEAATPRLSPLWWAELEILSVEAT